MMKIRIAMLVVLLLASATPYARAEAKDLDKVEEMLVAMGTEESVNSAVTQILYDLFVTSPEFDIHQDILLAYAEEHVSWDVIKGDLVKVYAAEFTDAEIAELTRFYKSKIGKKLVKASPDMNAKIGRVVKERFDSDLDVLEMQMKYREMDLLEEEALFYKDEGAE